MAVAKIEQYRQQNGADILKIYIAPSNIVPQGGYFYAPMEAKSLVDEYTWYLLPFSNGYVRVVTTRNKKNILFHRALFKFYHGYDWDGEIDHVNLVEVDNTDDNLNAVTSMQNGHNKITRGYKITNKYFFLPKITLNYESVFPCGCSKRTEDSACRCQHWVDTVWLKEQMGDQYYGFDFKKYRRGSEDILDLERTGVISEEEAIYRHILRYAQNPWYILRFGLEDYCRQYHIQVPRYALDSNGFMVHPITGQKLCPFYK